MRTSQLKRAASLIVAVPVLGFGLAGTSIAQAATPPLDHRPCDSFSSANACEQRMVRASANEAVWHSADLRFTDQRGQVTHVDLAEPGPGPGDALVFDNLLLDESGHGVVGRFLSRCGQLTDAMYRCDGSLLFPDGSIELSTTTSFGGDISAAVTSGTGRYAGVAGQVRIFATSNQDRSAIAVELDGHE